MHLDCPRILPFYYMCNNVFLKKIHFLWTHPLKNELLTLLNLNFKKNKYRKSRKLIMKEHITKNEIYLIQNKYCTVTISLYNFSLLLLGSNIHSKLKVHINHIYNTYKHIDTFNNNCSFVYTCFCTNMKTGRKCMNKSIGNALVHI